MKTFKVLASYTLHIYFPGNKYQLTIADWVLISNIIFIIFVAIWAIIIIIILLFRGNSITSHMFFLHKVSI